MKKLSYYLSLVTCAAMFAVSCSDDDVTKEEPQLLLTKVSRDGITVMELKYDIDRKLSRVNYYYLGNFSSYEIIEYNAQRPSEIHRYSVDPPQVSRKSVLTTDNFGRIIKSENYYSIDNFNNPQQEFVLTYDPSGRLKSRFYSTADNTSISLTEYTYEDHDQPIQSKIIVNPDESNEYVGSEWNFTLRDKPIYSHWTNNVVLLGLSYPGFDDYMWEMFNVSRHATSWNKDGDITSENQTEATENEFNSNGYLIRQVLTRHDLFKQEPDVVREMTYEYTDN